jgi:hypothetical protein
MFVHLLIALKSYELRMKTVEICMFRTNRRHYCNYREVLVEKLTVAQLVNNLFVSFITTRFHVLTAAVMKMIVFRISRRVFL